MVHTLLRFVHSICPASALGWGLLPKQEAVQRPRVLGAQERATITLIRYSVVQRLLIVND